MKVIWLSLVSSIIFVMFNNNPHTNNKKIYCDTPFSTYLVKENYTDDSHCFNSPIRKYYRKKYCLYVYKNECTVERLIDECYKPFPCINNYKTYMITLSRENTRAEEYVNSVSVCCKSNVGHT